jgi:hypothetical protein
LAPESCAWDAFLGSALIVLVVSLLLPVWAIWIELGQPGLRARPYAHGTDRRRADLFRFVQRGEGDWEITGPNPAAGSPSCAAARAAVIPAGLPVGRGTEAAAATHLPPHAPASPSPRRAPRKNLLTVAAVMVGCTLVGLTWRSEKASQFDRQIWIPNPNRDVKDNPRSRMVGDLMRHHLKLGVHRRQVKGLLGEPDQEVPERGEVVDQYDLGYMGWFGIDASVLQLEYDQSGKLAATSVFEM